MLTEKEVKEIKRVSTGRSILGKKVADTGDTRYEQYKTKAKTTDVKTKAKIKDFSKSTKDIRS